MTNFYINIQDCSIIIEDFRERVSNRAPTKKKPKPSRV